SADDPKNISADVGSVFCNDAKRLVTIFWSHQQDYRICVGAIAATCGDRNATSIGDWRQFFEDRESGFYFMPRKMNEVTHAQAFPLKFAMI
ncbi:hypothetical protein ACLE20_15055, partial [Rhizobium sp. YIM 134829]|uniref:hypothetical protein n=1 Tax=Rhizobium sp. YIM 134829 TaxID=3390453 RepID=UPI0039781B53